jgi:urea transport system permease protein
LVLLFALWGAMPVQAQSRDDAAFLATLGELKEATYSDKASIVERLSQGGHPSVRAVLTAFMEDRLFFRNNDQKVFVAKSAEGSPLSLVDPLTLKDAGTAPTEELTKIGTNNALRRTLRTTVAHFGLSSPAVSVRLEAVREMNGSLDEKTVALLRQRIGVETDAAVKKEIGTGLALAALDGLDANARLRAIATLRSSVSQDVRNRLALLLDKSPGGGFAEGDEKVRAAAALAVASIDGWRTFYSGVETLFFGLSLGSVLVLIAIGLAITFGVMGVINMAHGELMMLGAYTTYVVQLAMPGHIGISILVAIPAAFIVAGLTGVLMERTIIRFLYGRPLETRFGRFFPRTTDPW